MQERRVRVEHEHHWRKKLTTDYVVSFSWLCLWWGIIERKDMTGPGLSLKSIQKRKTHVKLRRRWKYGYRPMAIKTFFREQMIEHTVGRKTYKKWGARNGILIATNNLLFIRNVPKWSYVWQVENYFDARCRNSTLRKLIVSKQDSKIKISANISLEFVGKLINKNLIHITG